MSNTLTGLIPTVYTALDIVSRELVGVIPGVQRDSTTERAAVGQTVSYPIVPQGSLEDITPAVTPPSSGSQTIGVGSLTITKSKAYPILWNGEEQKGLNTGGPGVNSIMVNQFAQGFRTMANAIETDLAGLSAGFSRAWGTAGTTPFASDLSDPANLRKILDDNGAPASGRSLVINTTAGAKVRTLAQLTKANEAGTADFLRNGQLLDIHNFSMRESAQIVTVGAVGTASGATTNNAGYAVGATVITCAAAGTGTILAGDFVTFAGDTNKYGIAPGGGLASAAAGGTITLAAPGLMKALPASATAITVLAASARNMAYTQNALVLAMRAPALPEGGDSADDRITVQDPKSGLFFEIATYKMYRQVRMEIAAAWGVKLVKPEHTAVLLG
jgi:hypothetical protein